MNDNNLPRRDGPLPIAEGKSADSTATRREALLKAGKFAAFVAPAAYVLLDSTAAQAQPCSQHPSPVPGQNCT